MLFGENACFLITVLLLLNGETVFEGASFVDFNMTCKEVTDLHCLDDFLDFGSSEVSM
jgi:hypothetical protein